MHFNTISVIGLGYIGLPTAAIIASRGINVIGVDVSQQAVDTINSGGVHIVEPDLDIVVRSTVSSGLLKAKTTPEKADAFMIAVPTPFKDGYQADLSYIKAAAESISAVLEKGNLVVLESTSPVGATEQLADWLAELRPDLTFPRAMEMMQIFKLHIAPKEFCPAMYFVNSLKMIALSVACLITALRKPQHFISRLLLVTVS